MALAPHAPHLPAWMTIAVACCLIWRFGTDNYAWRIPPRWLRILLLLLAVLATFKTYGTFLGREAGVAFLSLAIGLKVLEIKSLRDYLISVFLIYFLLLGAFLNSQSMMTGAYGFAVALLSTASLALLNSSKAFTQGNVWGLVGRLVLFGLPICLVMYVFFPRIQGSLWGLPQDAFGATTGMSDQVSPGAFERLSHDFSPAFRVEFHGQPPESRDLYWRVHVLSRNQNRSWRRREVPFDGAGPGGFEAKGPITRYTITLEPHNQHWLPGLDLPLEVPQGYEPKAGFLFESYRPVNRVLRYSLSSQQSSRTNPLNPIQRRINLQTDGLPSVRVQQLLNQWQGLAPSQKVDAVLTHIREQPFRYTLTPPRLGADPVDEFLFDTQAGYCEHYASTFVSLMRWSGIPARMLVGYQGGEWNESGGYLTVYQSDAHAWAEVWLPDRGWTRVDPTSAVAPERIELGADAIRELVEQGFAPGELSGLELRQVIARPWFQQQWHNALLAWDAVNHNWNKWVMAYGPEAQFKLLRWMGFKTPTWTQMAVTLTVAVALLMLLVALVITRYRIKPDPIVKAYQRACRKLLKHGIEAFDNEGPLDLQHRIEKLSPTVAQRFKPISEMYIAIRYGDEQQYSIGVFKALVAKL